MNDVPARPKNPTTASSGKIPTTTGLPATAVALVSIGVSMRAERQSNFSFLKAHDAQLMRLGMLVERCFAEDPNTSTVPAEAAT